MIDTWIRFFAVVGFVVCIGGTLAMAPTAVSWLKQRLRKREIR
jgi:hypothetical protein